MKMKFNYRSSIKLKLFLLLCCFLAISSCKKQFNTDDISSKAIGVSEWYQKSTTNTSVQFKNSNGEVFPTSIVPKWNKMINLGVEGAAETYQVPVEMKLPEALKQINFGLNISADGEPYKGKLVPLNFGGDFLTDKAIEKPSKPSSPINKTMGGIGQDPIGPAPSCIDWYLVTTYYDASGNVVRIIENYVYTTCGDGGGGGSSSASTSQDIKPDTSILNNPKIKCLLDKLLGLDSTAGNPQMLNLLNAFVGKGFDVTFKIGTTKPTSWGEAAEDPYDPTKYNIVLNRNRINEGYQMDWVKTMLHEAFHVNLMQKTYALFGNAAVALWSKKPEEMSVNELMDYTTMKAEASGNPVLKAEHHNFMAQNFEVIRDGLKSFSLANNPNHADFDEDRFEALAYQGLTGTSYYINKICKDTNGDVIRLNYSGGNYTLAEVHMSKADNLRIDSVIPCN